MSYFQMTLKFLKKFLKDFKKLYRILILTPAKVFDQTPGLVAKKILR